MPTPIFLDKCYYINVGDHGSFKPSGNPDYNTTAANVDELFDHLKANGQRRLVVFFHGGLVNARRGMQSAERISRYVKLYTQSHPVCFVWETGLLETIWQNFDTLQHSEFFKKLLVRIVKAAGKKLGIDLKGVTGGAKGLGDLSDEEVRWELQKDEPFAHYQVNDGKKSVQIQAAEFLDDDEAIEALISPEIEAILEEEIYEDRALQEAALAPKTESEDKLMDPDKKLATAEGQKGIIGIAQLVASAGRITVQVVKRHLKKRDHGFYPTIIEEILREFYVADLGTWVWGRMKAKARSMWEEDDFQGDQEDWKAGSYFLQKLDAYQKEVGELTIDLVGHSAGSIAIKEMLESVGQRHPDLKFRHILFLAPAIRCEEFHETLLKEPLLFQDFRCFTMADDYEIKDRLVPIIYPRSLLYFISGVLENDSKEKDQRYDAYLLGLQRHISGKKPYDQEECLKAIQTFLSPAGRIVFSVTEGPGEDGLRSTAEAHSVFDDEGEKTLDSLMYIINQ